MNAPVNDKQDPGPWPLIAKLLSAIWMIIVIIFVARGFSKAPTFEKATEEHCSQLLIPVFLPLEHLVYKIDKNRFPQLLHWKDRLSGDEILPYRRGAKVLDCDSLDSRVAMFAKASKQGLIQPTIGVNWIRMILIIVVPSILIFAFCFLMGSRPKKPEKPVHRIS